jgi:small subunit ribosomal protein S20
MANIASAKKRIRQSAKRRLANRYKMVTARNLMKKVRRLTSKEEAVNLIPELNSKLDRLANHNIIHKRTAANYKSKITKHVNALA